MIASLILLENQEDHSVWFSIQHRSYLDKFVFDQMFVVMIEEQSSHLLLPLLQIIEAEILI